MKANEYDALNYYNAESAMEDKKVFLHNLADLLSQTTLNVSKIQLNSNNTVDISFKDREPVNVFIGRDSYLNIILDIVGYF